MHDKYPKAGKNKISSIDVSPCLCQLILKLEKLYREKAPRYLFYQIFQLSTSYHTHDHRS